MTNLVSPKKATPNCPQHSENPLKIYCATCSTLICTDCTIRLHKDHNYDLVADVLTQHKEELVSSLKPVKEKLVTVQQALKDFDTRVKAIYDQKATIEANIHGEIDAQHALLDQQRTELVRELDMLTQQKIKALATQRDNVEMTEAKLSSCVAYVEGGLKTGTDDEVLEMKVSVLKRTEQIFAAFDPNALTPETIADMKLVIKGKECLQQACRGFLDIDYGEKFSSENSQMTGDGLKHAKIGKTKIVYFAPMTKNKKKFKGQLDLKAEFFHTKSKRIVKCEVVVQKNGRYEISYCPVYRGKHELHISVNKVPVRGSPFPITVTCSLPEKPVRVIQGLNKPRGVVLNSKGRFVIVDDNGASISVLKAEGEKIRSFGQLSNVFGITVDQDDNIFVVENSNCRIHKFSEEGVLLATAGSKGNRNLEFRCVYDICYNRGNNNLYVVDYGNGRIQVLTTDLKFVQCFGACKSENGQLQKPKYAAFDSANNLYVTDNHRVQVFTANGQFLRAFSQKENGQKLNHSWAIAIDSSDTVYVSEYWSNCVSVFTSQGEYITTISGQGSEQRQFKNINGLCIDCNNCYCV